MTPNKVIHSITTATTVLCLLLLTDSCNLCHDVACSYSGLEIALIHENGNPVETGNFKFSVEFDGFFLEGDCSFTDTQDYCRLSPIGKSKSKLSGKVFRLDRGIVLTLTIVEGENVVGPSMVEVQILQNAILVGQKSFTPIYEVDEPNPNDPNCAYCLYANDQMVIAPWE